MSCCKQKEVKSIPQEDLWWGEAVCGVSSSRKMRRQTISGTAIIGPYFVRADSKSCAENKIKEIVRLEYPEAGGLYILDTTPGERGPYQVIVSQIDEVS